MNFSELQVGDIVRHSDKVLNFWAAQYSGLRLEILRMVKFQVIDAETMIIIETHPEGDPAWEFYKKGSCHKFTSFQNLSFQLDVPRQRKEYQHPLTKQFK